LSLIGINGAGVHDADLVEEQVRREHPFVVVVAGVVVGAAGDANPHRLHVRRRRLRREQAADRTVEAGELGDGRLGVGEPDVRVPDDLQQVVQPRLRQWCHRRHRAEDVTDGGDRKRRVDLHHQLSRRIQARSGGRLCRPSLLADQMDAARQHGGHAREQEWAPGRAPYCGHRHGHFSSPGPRRAEGNCEREF
jgi:hypothetical protein